VVEESKSFVGEKSEKFGLALTPTKTREIKTKRKD
jgi:hypothetical protein